MSDRISPEHLMRAQMMLQRLMKEQAGPLMACMKAANLHPTDFDAAKAYINSGDWKNTMTDTNRG